MESARDLLSQPGVSVVDALETVSEDSFISEFISSCVGTPPESPHSDTLDLFYDLIFSGQARALFHAPYVKYQNPDAWKR